MCSIGSTLTLNYCTRDWRGIAEFARIDVPSISSASRISPSTHCINLWGLAGGTVAHLVKALEAMDRFDVIHDIKKLIGELKLVIYM